MTHLDRGRLSVDLTGNWRLYTNIVRPTCDMLGTVTQDSRTGALARTSVGIYVMINAGASTSLDQRRVKAALGISNNAGKPTTLDGGRKVNVYLDAESLERAETLGQGNVSAGIRAALLRASDVSRS